MRARVVLVEQVKVRKARRFDVTSARDREDTSREFSRPRRYLSLWCLRLSKYRSGDDQNNKDCPFHLIRLPLSKERIIACMKPAPAPEVPGNTEFERFDNAVRKMFAVSKEDVVREERRQQRARTRKRRVKKSA